MKIGILFYFLSFFLTSLKFAKGDANEKQVLTSDEFLSCDYTHIESQLEALRTSNDFVKRRVEIIQMLFTKQSEVLQDLAKKIDKIPQSLQGEESATNGKWQMMTDIKKTVKGHDVLFETFNEKLKNVENILRKASWETYAQKLGDSISKNLTILQNIEKKLTELEATAATKTDQLALNLDIQNSIHQNETNQVCLITEDKKLICNSHSSPCAPSSCADMNSNYCVNGKCHISNPYYGPDTFLVTCDNQTDGGGWTVIQRRINGSVDFYRDWADYKKGFGNIDADFFIGLDKLHALTTTLQPMELYIKIQDFNNTTKYAKYDEFLVGNETENYKLHKVGRYSGNALDSLKQHMGFGFTTKDRDNDDNKTGNCAVSYKGAWWFKYCFSCHLNGIYYDKSVTPRDDKGICWNNANGCEYSLKYVQMMIRPKKK